MTEKKTLQLRSPSEQAEAPTVKKRGRGWEISGKRLDALHDRARDMKRHSSEAHKVLAERFAKADLGQNAFTRYAVVGSAILDFNCHNLGMAVCIDEEGDNETLSQRRDKSLESIGIRVMRVKAADVLENIDDVLARITAGMRLRMADRKGAHRRHIASNPNQTAPTRAYKPRTADGPRKYDVKDR
jgi:very-short-patch-repair endonuclease